MLWGKSAHNSFVSTLADNGITGFAALLWVLFDFRAKNLKLRTEASVRRWAELGGRFDLRNLALALEAGMVAWVCAALLYSLGGTHWLYTLLAMNLTLHALITRAAPPRGAGQPTPRGRSRPQGAPMRRGPR
jgi:hypothetical protein